MTTRFQLFHPLDEMPKIGNHFRRATSEIHSRNIRVREPIDDPISCLPRHNFLALRPSVHMAMHAGEIAKLAHVDLQDFRAPAAEQERTFDERLCKSIHCNQQQLPLWQHQRNSYYVAAWSAKEYTDAS